jgi:hypothetical protein
MDHRQATIYAIRAVLNRLADDPDIPMPYSVEAIGHGKPTFRWLPSGTGKQETAEAARIRRALGGKWDKHVGDQLLKLHSEDDHAHYEIVIWRTAACTRVVTGTKTVTETVPDPDALAAVPMVEITRQVEEFRWDCAPILATEHAVAVTK